MMIKPPLCIDCGKPKKTRKGIRCRDCAVRHYTNKNSTWSIQEHQQIAVYLKYTREIAQLNVERQKIIKNLIVHHTQASVRKRVSDVKGHKNLVVAVQ